MSDYFCEKCDYYIFIDSGYGYCMRFPPIYYIKYFRLSWKLRLVPVYELKYPHIPWCQIPCEEFKRKERPKK